MAAGDSFKRITFIGTSALSYTFLATPPTPASPFWVQICNDTTQTLSLLPNGSSWYSGTTGGLLTSTYSLTATSTSGAACVTVSVSGDGLYYVISNIGPTGAQGATGPTGPTNNPSPASTTTIMSRP